MQIDPKALEAARKAAWRTTWGPLVGSGDGHTRVAYSLNDESMRKICAAAIRAYEAAKPAVDREAVARVILAKVELDWVGYDEAVIDKESVTAAADAILALINGKEVMPSETGANARSDDTSPRQDVRAAGGAVPQGWKLVPIEPTSSMLDCIHDGRDVAARRYAAMLAAAPEPPHA